MPILGTVKLATIAIVVEAEGDPVLAGRRIRSLPVEVLAATWLAVATTAGVRAAAAQQVTYRVTYGSFDALGYTASRAECQAALTSQPATVVVTIDGSTLTVSSAAWSLTGAPNGSLAGGTFDATGQAPFSGHQATVVLGVYLDAEGRFEGPGANATPDPAQTRVSALQYSWPAANAPVASSRDACRYWLSALPETPLPTASASAASAEPASASSVPGASPVESPGPAPTESGGGVPLPLVLGLGALAALLGGGLIAWQRGRSAETATVCDELGARYRTMAQARVRRAAGLAQGLAALDRAYAAERDASAARDALASQRNEAAGLLGSAGVVATGVIGSYAAGLSGAAAALRSALAFVEGGGEALLDYLPTLQGGAAPTLGLGASVTGALANAEADAQALTGLAALPAGASLAEATDMMTHGLARLDDAMAAASSTRQQLEVACQTSRRDLDELDDQIGAALAQLATCPGGPADLPADPRSPLPPLPVLPGAPPRG
jgi:hypothetical protein